MRTKMDKPQEASIRSRLRSATARKAITAVDSNLYSRKTRPRVNKKPVKDASTQTECISSSIGCPICLLDLNELLSAKVSLVNVNICKHFLCGPCLTSWLAKENNCPLCRTNLRGKKPFTQLYLT